LGNGHHGGCDGEEDNFYDVIGMVVVEGRGGQIQAHKKAGEARRIDPLRWSALEALDKLQSISKLVGDRKVYRVVVVDDSLLPRAAARALLGNSPALRLVGEASSGEQALSVVESARPDLVLVDVHMPGMDGAATAKALLEQNPELKVIAWTVSDSSDDLLRMIRAGCSGYVLKDSGPSELDRALMAALRSESPVPRKMIPDVLRRVAEQAPPPPPGTIKLTSREMQILRGAAKGFTSKRLAAESGLAVPSVDSHLRNIFRKLRASNRGEAVSTAMKLGLITLGDL
jgi:two-component system, NarL family, nitrate/nitrite response regulator NarL